MERTSLARPAASAQPCTRVTVLCARWQADTVPAVNEPDITAMLGDWQLAACQVVSAHGGQWCAATDHMLSATFGAVSGEADHAERALRCGQAWLAAAQAHVAITRQRWPQLEQRLGVGAHSGPPAVDAPAGTPQRDTADRAARIAQAVPPGRLGISLDTAAHVRGLFEMEPPLPLPVDKRDPPLQTLLLGRDLLQPARNPAPGIGAPSRPMVARKPELAILQAAFTQLFEGHPAQAVTVSASGGMGKSRLLRAFDDWSGGQPVAFHAWRAHAQPQTRSQPFGLLRELVRTFCRIRDEDTAQAARQRLEQAIAPWFVHDEGADRAAGQAHAHALGHLIGVDVRDSPHIQGVLTDPQRLRRMAFDAATQWLRRLGAAGSSPVLLHIEDLHWADDDTLDFLDHLIVVNHDVALLIVATARPELANRRPAWARDEGVHRCIDLCPLDAPSGRKLAAGLLGQLPDIPAALLDRVVRGAKGNPFCIEERVHLLIDQGAIRAGLGGWSLDNARLHSARLPDTLTGVLAARLALLPATERSTLQRASVIGSVFLGSALRALGVATARTLDALQHRQLTLSHGAPGADATPQFSFKHQLLQELTYGSVPTVTRRNLHGKLAHWLLALTGQQASDVLALSAHHFELAGAPAMAAEQHARAAEQAVLRYAAEAVFGHVESGLTLLAGLPVGRSRRELQWRLRMTRVHMLELRGQHALHLADIDGLTVLADELGDDLKRAQVADKRSVYAMFTSDYAGAMAAARQTMACAERIGEHRMQLLGMRMLAWAHCTLGDWDAGHRLLQECLTQARAHELPSVEAACANTLSHVAMRQQDTVARLHWHELELTLRRRLGDQRQESMVLANLGGGWLALGELFQSRHCCEEALRLAHARGDRRSECFPLYHLSILERWLGNGAQAATLARAAADAAVAAGIKDWELFTLTALGEAELAAGRLDAADDALLRAQDLAGQRKLPDQPDNVAGLARLALARGDVRAAMQHVQRVLDLEAATGVAHQARNQGHVNLVCHLVLARAMDPRADAWLQRAHGQLLATAAKISDEALREGFLANIPDHRAILAAWAAAAAPAPRA